MENASKALIIAASVLITVMLFSFMFYVFRHFGSIAQSTENVMTAEEIDRFNSQFSKYGTSLDEASIELKNPSTGAITTSTVKYSSLFGGTYNTASNTYMPALVNASHTLNKVTDVVSAVNLAIDINNKNNNSYKYDYTEIDSSVEIIVDLGTDVNSSVAKKEWTFNKYGGNTHYRYLLIEPNKNVKPYTMYGVKAANSINTSLGSNYKNKFANASNLFPTIVSNEVDMYKMLEELRTTKVVPYDNKTYTVYKYYFTGEYFFNPDSTLIETVKFTLIEDKGF